LGDLGENLFYIDEWAIRNVVPYDMMLFIQEKRAMG
jgi:hypothetical protein